MSYSHWVVHIVVWIRSCFCGLSCILKHKKRLCLLLKLTEAFLRSYSQLSAADIDISYLSSIRKSDIGVRTFLRLTNQSPLSDLYPRGNKVVLRKPFALNPNNSSN